MDKLFAIVISYNPKLILLTKEYESVVNQVDRIIYIDENSQIYDFKTIYNTDAMAKKYIKFYYDAIASKFD